jgi:hypothetical protein
MFSARGPTGWHVDPAARSSYSSNNACTIFPDYGKRRAGNGTNAEGFWTACLARRRCRPCGAR